MMKLSIVIGGKEASNSAFVVYRGFEEAIKKSASLGYDGIELALKSANEINRIQLANWLNDNNLKVSSISTGQIFASSNLMFTHPDKYKRDEVMQIFKDIIELASEFGQMVNIGRVRGFIGESEDLAVGRFIDAARELCDYALKFGVTLLLEPVNKSELNFINNVSEGAELLKKISCSNFKLMPDLYHMSMEGERICDELDKYFDLIGYLHIADSNRLAPGRGTLDFTPIFQKLAIKNYTGWLAVEILPQPTPNAAAKQAIDFIKPLLNYKN